MIERFKNDEMFVRVKRRQVGGARLALTTFW